MTFPPARPLVGLTGRRITGAVLTSAVGFQDAPVDAYLSEYAHQVTAAGGIPFHVPLGTDVAPLAGKLDALVLAGGDDLDPRQYGAVASPLIGPIDPRRDEFELALFQAMLDGGRPVLGVCRGAQLINVALGGTLVADLPLGCGQSHGSYAYPRALRRHSVRFVPGSLAHRLYGDEAEVNSFHHQAVDLLGRGVTVTGRADDGVVEAVELGGAPVLGVQWHPECLADDPAFDWLVEACSQPRGSHTLERA